MKKYTVHPETEAVIPMEDSNVIIACGDYFRVYTLEEFFVFSDADQTEVWGYNGERKLAAGIIRALDPNPKTACLTSNHGEIFYDYELVYLLDDAGYTLVTDFDLAEDDIPQNCTLIITYNPNTDLDVSEGVAENAKLDSFLERGRLVVDEVEGAFAVTKNVLRGIRGVSATQEHSIIVLTCNVIRLNERVRTEVSLSVLAKRADDYRRHREKERCLIKIIYYS